MKTVSRSLQPGTIIHNRYQIKRELGAGGFGITYEVLDQRENCIVAMKEFMPRDVANRWTGSLKIEPKPGQQQNYERFQKKFLDEAQLIYQYRNHPNIVEVKHLFRENNTAYYTMEYLEGVDFGKLIKLWGPQVPWERMEKIISQTVLALGAIHENGLVHCDISPDNVCVLENGIVKLIDFGAAKNYIKGPSSIIFLKKGFAPPEQYVSDGKLGPWTDIYALAVMIYFAFTGKMPPEAAERLNLDKIIWPSQMGMKIPNDQWEAALKKALELRPENRYQDVKTFWRDLNENEKSVILVLECIQGCYQGKWITADHETLFGTDSSKCHIQFPAGREGISRVHMRVWRNGQMLFAMDMGSSYGTYLNRNIMTPGLVYTLAPGDILQIGRSEIFKVTQAEIS